MNAHSALAAGEAGQAALQEEARNVALRNTMRVQRIQDFIFHKVTLLFAASVLVVLVGIIISLAIGAAPAFREFGASFLVTNEWDPVNDKFGALIAITGTLVTSFIALLVAFPVSFGIALFLTEICPTWLRRPMGMAVELLAGVPSIIYGMWGLFVFAPLFGDHVQPLLKKTLGVLPFIGPFFQGPTMGLGLLTAGIILAVMIIPIITSLSREVIETTPPGDKEGALALGCTRWEMIRAAVIPHSAGGLVGAIMLGLGRAMGETIAAALVIGSALGQITIRPFAPGNSMPAVIANEWGEADALHKSALIALAVTLFIITVVVNLIASTIVQRSMKKAQGL